MYIGKNIFSKKLGFTLAEVLITLGIIGIVAEMVIPTLIIQYKKQEAVTQLKVTYSILSQAVKMSELDNGPVDNWEYERSVLSANDFYKKYLKPYLKVSKEYFNVARPENVSYLFLNNTTDDYWSYYYPSTPKIVLNNGTLISVTNINGLKNQSIGVDINNFKGPNKWGKDFFFLNIQPKYGVTPYGFGNAYENNGFGTSYDREKLTSTHESACNKNSKGTWCAALILMDSWQIKDDYPW